MSGFRGVLGVVRVQITGNVFVAAAPQPVQKAVEQLDDFLTRLRLAGAGDGLVLFARGDGLPCWIRARDVMTVDVVSTEDPSA